jgi:hypothetical protein
VTKVLSLARRRLEFSRWLDRSAHIARHRV